MADINQLEKIINRPITDEEAVAIDLYNKGQTLAQLVVSPSWPIILEILQSYATNSMNKLISLDPADKENIIAEHAVAHAAKRIYQSFVEDVQAAVEMSRKPPAIAKDVSFGVPY
jgi:hypothetical protein